jgi:hypothetical protein
MVIAKEQSGKINLSSRMYDTSSPAALFSNIIWHLARLLSCNNLPPRGFSSCELYFKLVTPRIALNKAGITKLLVLKNLHQSHHHRYLQVKQN